MNAPLPHALLPAVLLAGLPLLATSMQSAQAAGPVKTSAAAECIAPGADRDIRPSSTQRELLLRDGNAHYRIHLQKHCLGAAASARFTFLTRGSPGQICGNARSLLRTDSNHCRVSRIEPIDAAAYKRLAQQGR